MMVEWCLIERIMINYKVINSCENPQSMFLEDVECNLYASLPLHHRHGTQICEKLRVHFLSGNSHITTFKIRNVGHITG